MNRENTVGKLRATKLILVVLAVALICSTVVAGNVYIQLENTKQQLANLQTENATALTQVRSQYQADIDELQNYILSQPDLASGAMQQGLMATHCESDVVSNNELAAMAGVTPDVIVDKKYALFLPDLTLPQNEMETLKKLLAAREAVLNKTTASYYTTEEELARNVEQQQQALESIDKEVAAVLPQEEYENYRLLKDSGFEQYQQKQFNRALAPESQLDNIQQRSLLLAKLKNKDSFNNQLSLANQLAQDGGAAANDGKQLIMSALDSYSQNYFAEAKSVLTQEQYNALVEYESQQFSQMRRSLRNSME
ncbi:hypothetical protein KO528_07135 [Saccharophagus degradans]|uniref:Uncharacterized protein n=1 Tax=Saccharophagus degradans TaxID=86304 RepID=A0AAW7X1J7_9GAMM|nr:hypothetical protein [Saccharophagus degradans]MBU2985118.1 hypothetical protein [Saccharophagus degradans]MDO6421620.1 hypothetical protein [Saccharophagus degradans]MDO6608582.1 hypothetical protein [Saccharophagus degradans]